MKKLSLFFGLTLICGFCACKKDVQPTGQTLINTGQNTHSLEKGLLNLTVDGELLGADIDTALNLVTVVVPDNADLHKLNVTLQLASQVSATLNNTPVSDPIIFDFSATVNLTVKSADGQRKTTFIVDVEHETQYIGFDGPIIAGKSLNKSYNYYYDQMDWPPYAITNCVPTVATMAMKWADSTFYKNPSDARNSNPQAGVNWTPFDAQLYMRTDSVNNQRDTLKNIDSLIKTNIDKNQLVIFCVYIGIVPYNNIPYQHTSLFYLPDAQTIHCILVKGYRQTAKTFYLEVYDPNSGGQRYQGLYNGQLKGIDRYYIDKDVDLGSHNYDGYVTVVARKGQKVK